MKFRDPQDQFSFLSEAGRLDLLEASLESKKIESSIHEFQGEEIPVEVFEVFIKNRKKLVDQLKNHRKSIAQKENWRRNRRKILGGIKKFHRSTQGKKFHRQLGRFLASHNKRSKSDLFNKANRIQTHTARSERSESKIGYYGIRVEEFLTAISSVRTHLYIELGYYRNLCEDVDYALILDIVLPALDAIEAKVRNHEELNEEELDIVLRLIDSKVLEEIFEVKIDETKLIDEENYLVKLIGL